MQKENHQFKRGLKLVQRQSVVTAVLLIAFTLCGSDLLEEWHRPAKPCKRTHEIVGTRKKSCKHLELRVLETENCSITSCDHAIELMLLVHNLYRAMALDCGRMTQGSVFKVSAIAGHPSIIISCTRMKM